MFYVLYYYHQTYAEKNYRQNKFFKMNYNFFIKFFGVLGRGPKFQLPFAAAFSEKEKTH